MRIRLTKRRWFWSVVLFGLWLVLSRSLDPWHLAAGAIAAVVVALLNTSPDPRKPPSIRWLAAATYGPWLFTRIFLSGLHLSYLILHPKLPIRPRLFQHRTGLGHEDGIMLLSSSITLTPGTITVEADDGVLTVHAIDRGFARDLTSKRLEGKVSGVFRERGMNA